MGAICPGPGSKVHPQPTQDRHKLASHRFVRLELAEDDQELVPSGASGSVVKQVTSGQVCASLDQSFLQSLPSNQCTFFLMRRREHKLPVLCVWLPEDASEHDRERHSNSDLLVGLQDGRTVVTTRHRELWWEVAPDSMCGCAAEDFGLEAAAPAGNGGPSRPPGDVRHRSARLPTRERRQPEIKHAETQPTAAGNARVSTQPEAGRRESRAQIPRRLAPLRS
eukprot:TRINITY_DN9668_c0_g1_i2.p2 TRINITY_DN9668_c0_g1~~TRINITY_DN9668_c0_g1_i2.p2  ORF type:complete len:223 (-),score=41.47 TRINITY_DN9668_c0_g1_i2:898-1566(-)